MTPERLLSSEELPAELRWIASEYRLQRDDPVFLLLAWHWQQTQAHESRLHSLLVELKSVLDLRMSTIAAADSRMESFSTDVATLLAALDHQPDRIASQVASVLAPSLGEVTAHAHLAAERLGKVATASCAIQRETLLAALLSGAAIGALFVITLRV